MTETRQVIQVPGAPPISIRFGARAMPPQPPAEAQQVCCPPTSVQMHKVLCALPLQAVHAVLCGFVWYMTAILLMFW